MDVQKIPKRPPPLHFLALCDLPETSKKIGNFFPIFSFLRAFVVSSCRKSGFRFRVFLSLRYGADLGRSRLVSFITPKIIGGLHCSVGSGNVPAHFANSPSSSSGSGSNGSSGVASSNSSLQQVVLRSSPSGPAHNWQSMKTSMRERLAFLFNNEIMSDVKFIVGRGVSQQRIPAHKFVLSIGSAVFNAMFNGSMATADTEIELPDVEPVAFMFLLKFLYTDEAHIGTYSFLVGYLMRKRGCFFLSNDNPPIK